MKFISAFSCVALLLAHHLAAQTYTFSSLNFYATGGGIAIDSTGNVYVSNYYAHTVSKQMAGGAFTDIAGQLYSSGTNDGTGSSARFDLPRGIAVDGSGNIFVVDSNNQTLRKITPAGVVTTFVGKADESGAADGTGAAARFANPQGVAIDAQGNLFVADTNNHTIRKITPSGAVTTFAGTARTAGAVDASGAAARFDMPQGVAIDSAGTVYIADTNNHAIRKITSSGVVTTFAGSLGNSGAKDGTGLEARFLSPQALAIDKDGNVFVCDTANYTVRKITPAGVVTTIGGLAGNSGTALGMGSIAHFYGGRAIAIDGTGSLYIADSYGLRLAVPSSELAITVAPQPQSVAAGSQATMALTATGGTPITYQWQKDGIAIAGATNARFVIASVQAGDTGTYAVTVTNPVGKAISPGAALTVLAALPNDNFANAQSIADVSGSVLGHNNGATAETGEPTHVSATATASSVWYQWTAPQSGTTVLELEGNSYGLATSVYTGDTLTSLSRVAQSPGNRVVFAAQRGTTYRIVIGSNYGTRGNFTLRWRMILNDNFAQAQLLLEDSGKVLGSNDASTTEAGEPNHLPGSSAIGTSVWYRWTPSKTGTAIFDTNGTNFQTVVAIYTGNVLSSLTPVAAGMLSYNSGRVVANVTAGTTYFIAVGSYAYTTGPITLNWQLTQLPVITQQPAHTTVMAGAPAAPGVVVTSATGVTYQWYKDGVLLPNGNNSTYPIASARASDAGTYSVVITNAAGSVTSAGANLTVLVPPSNDTFANALPLVGLTGSVAGSNVNATGEAGEPFHWNSSGTATSVWFKWAAPSSGLAIVDTVGSTFDTVLAVYSGSQLTSLTRLTQDDDRAGGRNSQVSFAATAGMTYYIAVGSGTGGRGALTLNWQLSPTLAIATQPLSQTVAVGGAATFRVEATGSGVTYQWMRNGTPIPGATGSSLTVSNIQGGTDANFTVVVTSSSGTVTSAPATLAVAAPMLTTFAARNTRQGGGMLWSIAAGNNTLVAVGGGGNILSSTDNGATWIPRNSGNNLWLVAVTYGSGQFVVVGEAGTILTSTDGANWTPAAAAGTTERINNVLFADGKFVAVGEGGVILTSLDARRWTVRTSGVKTWLHGLAYNSKIGCFAADGAAGVFLISTDAINWTPLPIDGVKGYLEAVVPGDSYAEFVAVGHHETTGNAVCVSIHQNQLRLKTGETATTWSTEETPMGSTEGLVGLASGAGALFASGASGKIISAKDSRGPWYTIPSGTDEVLLSAMFYNDTLFVVGGRETILQSDILFNSRLVNISTRGQVGTGSNILISGFVVTGSKPKQVLVRAAGPALGVAPFNLPGVLANPVLNVLDEKNVTVGTNAGWSTSDKAAAIVTTTAQVGAFPFAQGSADSAILLTLNPGQYYAHVSGANSTTGLAIVEVYDADAMSNNGSRAINISTRGVTGSGENVMIAGFIVNGAASRRLLIRAAGPALARLGISGAAVEPQLSLYNGRGVLTASASAWGLQSNVDEVRSTAKAIGAFDFDDTSKDSAMLVTLLPGAWTVQVTTAGNTPGVALIEVYEVP